MLGGFESFTIILVLVVYFVPQLLFILTLRKAVNRCDEKNRAISPMVMWFLLLPIIRFILLFFIVPRVSKSLTNEAESRGMDPPAANIKTFGLAYAVFDILTFIPKVLSEFIIFSEQKLFLIFIFLELICWIVYWMKVHRYSSQLKV